MESWRAERRQPLTPALRGESATARAPERRKGLFPLSQGAELYPHLYQCLQTHDLPGLKPSVPLPLDGGG